MRPLGPVAITFGLCISFLRKSMSLSSIQLHQAEIRFVTDNSHYYHLFSSMYQRLHPSMACSGDSAAILPKSHLRECHSSLSNIKVRR
ncbi:hypothetical protein EV421DRAFT_1755964, partial [Armillaria borealis]